MARSSVKPVTILRRDIREYLEKAGWEVLARDDASFVSYVSSEPGALRDLQVWLTKNGWTQKFKLSWAWNTWYVQTWKKDGCKALLYADIEDWFLDYGWAIARDGTGDAVVRFYFREVSWWRAITRKFRSLF